MSREEQMSVLTSRIDRIEVAHAQQRRRDLLRLERDHRVPGAWLPFSKVLLLFAMVMALKAVAVSTLGEGAYRAHVSAMSDGTTLERMVGILLTPDRFTLELAQFLTF
jgi:hypothetical protein